MAARRISSRMSSGPSGASNASTGIVPSDIGCDHVKTDTLGYAALPHFCLSNSIGLT